MKDTIIIGSLLALGAAVVCVGVAMVVPALGAGLAVGSGLCIVCGVVRGVRCDLANKVTVPKDTAPEPILAKPILQE